MARMARTVVVAVRTAGAAGSGRGTVPAARRGAGLGLSADRRTDEGQDEYSADRGDDEQ